MLTQQWRQRVHPIEDVNLGISSTMTSFADTWTSEKKVRVHYEGFNFEVMNARLS
jgi:hypothetical protein